MACVYVSLMTKAMIHQWKRSFLEGAASIFERGSKAAVAAEVAEETVRDLHPKIGELAVANDHLSRKLKVILHCPQHRAPSLHRRRQGFPSKSFRTTLSSMASASRHLSLAFSSSSCFSRSASERPIPLYVAFSW